MFKWCHLSLMAHKTEIIKHLLAGLYCGGCACCMCTPMGATTAAEMQTVWSLLQLVLEAGWGHPG